MSDNGKPKINVLLALDKSGYDGNIHGGGRFFYNVASRVDRERFNLIACILRGEDSLKSALERQGVRVKYLQRSKFDPLVFFDLLKLIRGEDIHLLHLNSFASHQFGRLAAMIARVPTIVHAHGDADFRSSFLQRLFDRFLARFTDQLVAVSNEAKETYVRKRKIKPSKAIVMPNAIPLQHFKPSFAERDKLKRRLGVEPGHRVVGTVTRLWEQKGNRFLVEAAAKVLQVYPKTYFIIAGVGPLLDELKSLTRQLGINNKVVFPGFCDDVPGMLSIFDVYVIASLWEGFPIAILEAMAMAKPIVATSVGGVKEFLRDGGPVLMVPPADSEAIAAKIIYLLEHEEERLQLGKRAHEESVAKYGLDVYMMNLESLYEKVARKRKRMSLQSD